MSKQVELRAGIPEEMADPLEDYFCETESPYWGIMQKEVTDPYELFGIFPDEATARGASTGTRCTSSCTRKWSAAP